MSNYPQTYVFRERYVDTPEEKAYEYSNSDDRPRSHVQTYKFHSFQREDPHARYSSSQKMSLVEPEISNLPETYKFRRKIGKPKPDVAQSSNFDYLYRLNFPMERGYKPRPKFPYKTVKSYEFRKTVKGDTLPPREDDIFETVRVKPSRSVTVPETYEVKMIKSYFLFLIFTLLY